MNTQEEILQELKKLNFLISRSTVCPRSVLRLWERHSKVKDEEEV